jgi:L-serine deaminase
MIAVVCGLCGLFTAGGCNPESLRDPNQYQNLDHALQDANSLLDGLNHLADTPAGAAIPAPVRGALELLGIAGASALGLWQQLRKSRVTKTAQAIVQAVEELPATTQRQVKSLVKDQMIQQGTFSQSNKVVDELKAS